MKYTRMCCGYKSLPIIFFDVSDERIFEMNASEDSILPKSTVIDCVSEFDVISDNAFIPPIPAVTKPLLLAEEVGNE